MRFYADALFLCPQLGGDDLKEINKRDHGIIETNEYVIGNKVAKVTSVFKKTGKRTLSDAFIAIIKREKR